MKLIDLLKLLKSCKYMVVDLDSGLHTDYIPSWDTENPQLRTLLNKVVKVVRQNFVTERSINRLVFEVANA